MKAYPCILCIGGLDPSGGAGIQADIETVSALGGRALTLVTALTAQDSHDISAIQPVSPDFFSAQFELLMRDIRPDAIKIGLLGSTQLIPVVRDLLCGFECPLVLDPVLATGGGFDLDTDDLGRMMLEQLVPLTRLITPNRSEARRLGNHSDTDQAVRRLMQSGTDAILLTGADEATGDQVINQLFVGRAEAQSFSWPRLPHSYHGSGCTLASSIAGLLAQGMEPFSSIHEAQEYTWQTLAEGYRIGMGQYLPNRLFWARDEQD